MPFYRAAGLSASRRRAAWKNAATKSAAVSAFQRQTEKKTDQEKAQEEAKRKVKLRAQSRSKSSNGRLQGIKKQRALAEDRVRSYTDADVPTLRQEQKKKLNRMINEMYADDFAEDCRLLFFLLKHLDVKDKDVASYKEKVLKAEIASVETTFSQGFELLQKSKMDKDSPFPRPKRCHTVS